MKKYLALLSVLGIFLLVGCEKVEDVRLGVSKYSAHGTKAFAVTTVVMKGDIIESVLIDEYQYVDSTKFECVPNGDTTFAKDATCLASKRDNDDAYSANMAEKGGATKNLVESYNAIEEFAKGKTVEELTNTIKDKEVEDVVDAVSGSTLVDTKGYIEAIIEAVKNAK